METIYAVKIGSSMLAGITNQSMNLGVNLDKEPTDGSPYYTNVVLNGVDPRVSFATNQPIGLLGATGVAGAAISTGGLVLYLWKYAAGSARSNTSNNKIITINSGLLVPRRLSCQARGNVTFEAEALLTSPDGSVPWAVSTGSVPSYTDGGKYGVKSISLSNGSTATIESFDLDFGVQTIDDVGVDDYCPKERYIQQFDAKLTLSSSQAGWVSSSWAGEKVTATITLGRRGVTSQWVSGEDYTLTCYGIWTPDTFFDGSGNSPAKSTATMTLIKEGSTMPIVFGAVSDDDDT